LARNRPLGLKLIAALFLLEGAAVIIAVGIGLSRPEFRSAANRFIAQRVPFIEELNGSRFSFFLATLSALVSFAEGLGIWYLKRGAGAFIVYDLTYRLGAGVVAAAMLWASDRKMLVSIVSPPQYVIGLVTNILVLMYLLDPEIRQAFGIPDHESD